MIPDEFSTLFDEAFLIFDVSIRNQLAFGLLKFFPTLARHFQSVLIVLHVWRSALQLFKCSLLFDSDFV